MTAAQAAPEEADIGEACVQGDSKILRFEKSAASVSFYIYGAATPRSLAAGCGYPDIMSPRDNPRLALRDSPGLTGSTAATSCGSAKPVAASPACSGGAMPSAA
jgi:hypothetical protein